MKLYLPIVILAIVILSCNKEQAETATETSQFPESIYDFKVASLEGDSIDFSDYKGKKVLVVNTASECSFTYQYDGLEQLYQKHKDKLIIIGFPSNDFGGQEPGDTEDIMQVCRDNYGVTFPMAAKVSVQGDAQAPVYTWLTQKEHNNYQDISIEWNFFKFLIDEKGQMINVFPSDVEPNDTTLVNAIVK